MHNLLLEYTVILPEGVQENSCFKPLNEAGAKLFSYVEKTLPTDVKKTAAYHAFEKSWVEFINNSHDVGATHFKVRFLQHAESIEIEILDDGHGLPPKKETERYDWKKAVLSISDKAEDAKASGKKSCGQHLALSTTAYALERQDSYLAIKNREKIRGALVKIISPLTPCDSDAFFAPKKGNNLIVEMFYTIIEQDEKAIDQIREIASSPNFAGSRKKAAQSVINRMTSPDDTATTDSTPIMLLNSTLASPSFRKSPANNTATTDSTPTMLDSTLASPSFRKRNLSSSTFFSSPTQLQAQQSASSSSSLDASTSNNIT